MSAQHPTADDLRTIARYLISEGHNSRGQVIGNAAIEFDKKDARIAELVGLLKRAQGFVEYLANELDADGEEIQIERDIAAALAGEAQ